MPVAWRTDYAMRIMYETARLGPGRHASISTISESANVPYDFARQIANKLAHEGLLVSRRGSKGGFMLARPAERITLLDVFLAMGEKPTMSLCTHDETVCIRTECCPIHHGIWLPLDELIERQLRGMTLADAVARGAELEALLPLLDC
jgi:Rrf2 family protein